MTPYEQESHTYKKAKKRVRKIKEFYIHLSVYLLVNVLIYVVSSFEDGLLEGLTNIENHITAVLWGLGIIAHWIDVFGTNIFLGKDWEEQKVKELIEKDRKSTWE